MTKRKREFKEERNLAVTLQKQREISNSLQPIISSTLSNFTLICLSLKSQSNLKNPTTKNQRKERKIKRSMATRSPSPNPSRPKTPDFNNNLRKSKEIPQRSSVLKSSTPNSSLLRSSFEQKENLKSRSPSFSSCSKGSKNFMAPTISAASKVISASPRKKILQERNEVINSVTDSLEFPNKEESTGVVIDDVGSKSEMGFCSQEVSGSVEVKKGEFRTKKLQNVPPLSQISPLDADPSLPPYDPKTNYLSPRPQFLHYRPNPRIEHYLNSEGEFLDVRDGRKLEDSFSLENSEDDVTALTDEKDSEEEVSFHSEVEGWVSENETQFVAEPEPELKIKPLARRPFKRSKFIPFLLVLVFACIYAPLSDSPILSSSMLKDHIHSPSLGFFDDLHLRDYLAVANVGLHLNGLASRFKHWSTDSIGYFTSLNSPPKDDVGPYRFFNTTPLAVDESIDLSFMYETVSGQSIEETESEISEVAKEGDGKFHAEKMKMGVLDENSEMKHAENEAEKIEMEVSDEKCEMEHAENDAEKIEMEVSEDVKEDDIRAQRIEMDVLEDAMHANIFGYEMEKEIIGDEGRNELEQQVEVKVEVENTEMEPKTIVDGENYHDASLVAELEQDLSHLSYDTPGIEEDVENSDSVDQSGNIEEDVNDASSFDNPPELDEEFQTSPGLELLKSTNYGTILGLSLASLVLVSTFVFLRKKPKQIPMVKRETQTTKMASSIYGSSETYNIARGVVGDTGSEEVSSLDYIFRKREGDEEQNLRYEQRLRRDSAAFSSVSYGSFTSYERRSAKKGSKEEEEVVTPVRRSSRIRNKLTSP